MAAFPSAVTSRDELRDLYREPSQGSLLKQIDRLDVHCRDLIAHSPFMILSTADPDGRCDASPKGGPPGFVRVIDDHRLAFADMSGNNRLDSLENIVANSGVALLFLVPGMDETLRVNGDAVVTTDPATTAQCEVLGKVPRVAIGVTVREAYIHCAKALRRGNVWQPDAWPDLSGMERVACMLRDHINGAEDEDDVQARLDASYATTMWEVGGATERAGR